VESRDGEHGLGAVHRVGRALVGAVVATTVGLAGVVLTAAPAAADGAGGAITDDSGIDYGVLVGERGGGGSNPGRRRGGNGPTCTYRLMGGPENFPVFDVDGTVVQVETGGAWYEKTCDGVFVGAVYLRGAPNAVDPAEVAAGVLRRMTVPVPKVALSPAGEQVVNLPSWLWIANWEPLTGTASVGGVTVQVIARPSSARWSFGDGTSLACAPGVPWSPDADGARACTHTWRRSSASEPSERYSLGVSVTWTASYSVTGGAGGGALPSITRTSTQPVRVAEVQAVNDRLGG